MIASLFVVLMSPNAQAQGTCQQEFAGCMDRCGVRDKCIEACQARNTACANAVWSKPKPSYENMLRPSDESLAANEAEEKAASMPAPAPAAAKSKKAVRPEKRPVRQ